MELELALVVIQKCLVLHTPNSKSIGELKLGLSQPHCSVLTLPRDNHIWLILPKSLELESGFLGTVKAEPWPPAGIVKGDPWPPAGKLNADPWPPDGTVNAGCELLPGTLNPVHPEGTVKEVQPVGTVKTEVAQNLYFVSKINPPVLHLKKSIRQKGFSYEGLYFKTTLIFYFRIPPQFIKTFYETCLKDIIFFTFK